MKNLFLPCLAALLLIGCKPNPNIKAMSEFAVINQGNRIKICSFS